jgi:hypothetical protein
MLVGLWLVCSTAGESCGVRRVKCDVGRRDDRRSAGHPKWEPGQRASCGQFHRHPGTHVREIGIEGFDEPQMMLGLGDFLDVIVGPVPLNGARGGT